MLVFYNFVTFLSLFGKKLAKGCQIPSIHSAVNEVPGSRVGILKGAELTAIVVIREAISQTLISIPGYESPNSIALVLHQSPR